MTFQTAGLTVAALLASAMPLSAQQGHVPPGGFVPDAATAIIIARAVLIPIYGTDAIRRQEPLTAQRSGDIWAVQGTLQCPEGRTCAGGTAMLRLSARDGRITQVIHGK